MTTYIATIRNALDTVLIDQQEFRSLRAAKAYVRGHLSPTEPADSDRSAVISDADMPSRYARAWVRLLPTLEELPMTDRITSRLIQAATEMSFRELCGASDRLTSQSVHYFSKDPDDPSRAHRDIVQAMHLTRMGDVLRAIMEVRFPEAAE